MRDKINKAILEEALSFPLEYYLKSDGSINRTKLKSLHPDFYQDALNAIFIRKSIEVHGIFFGYENVKFSTMKQLVELYCPDHDGYFKQTAESHLKGNGCNQCSKKMVTRTNEYGSFLVPASMHQFYIDNDYIVWYNKFSKQRRKINATEVSRD